MKSRSLSLLFLFVFGFFSPSFSAVQASATDPHFGSCPEGFTDLVTYDDWRSVYRIRSGADGEKDSSWQRAIISEPKTKIVLDEEKPPIVSGVAGEGAEVRLFLFLPEMGENGVSVSKPDDGTCFVLGNADKKDGYFEFPVPTRLLWGSLASELALDVYYQQKDGWDQQPSASTNQNFFIGTNLPMKIVKVEMPPDTDECPKACVNTTGYSNHANESNLSVTLDPSTIDENLIGMNFDAVGNQKIVLARTPGASHNFFAGARDVDDLSALSLISQKAMAMEAIKRMLMGNENMNLNNIPIVGNPLSSVNVENLKEAAQQEGRYDTKVEGIAKSIKDILSDDETARGAAANFLADLFATVNNSPTKFPNTYKELFPEGLDPDDWAGNYIEMLVFWTGKTYENVCLMPDDNFVIRSFNGARSRPQANDCTDEFSLYYVNGSCPLLLLNTKEPVTITPMHKFTQIISSNLSFTGHDQWDFAPGKKEVLSYTYMFSRDFSPKYLSESCFNANDISEYADVLALEAGLTSDEKELVTQELSSVLLNDSLYLVKLANPSDISTRFRWKIGSREANILPLFFQISENSCSFVRLPSGHLGVEAENWFSRDGVEVGIIPSF